MNTQSFIKIRHKYSQNTMNFSPNQHQNFSMFATAKSLQSCPTLCDPIDGSPTGSPRPWDSPGKNTGVGCHFLLQCMKVKSESEVLQSCRTLHNPMDCSPSGSSIYGIFQARVLEWGAITFSEISCLGNLKSYSSFQFPNFYWAS